MSALRVSREVFLQAQQTRRVRAHRIAAQRKSGRAIQEEEPVSLRRCRAPSTGRAGPAGCRVRVTMSSITRSVSERVFRHVDDPGMRRQRFGAERVRRRHPRQRPRTMANDEAVQPLEHGLACVALSPVGRRRSNPAVATVPSFRVDRRSSTSQTCRTCGCVATAASSAVRSTVGRRNTSRLRLVRVRCCSEQLAEPRDVAEQRTPCR